MIRPLLLRVDAGRATRSSCVMSLWILFALLLATGSAADAQTPGNDSFTSASSIPPAGGTVTGTNVGSSTEVGEPSHGSGGGSVWWTWTPAANGQATIDTAGSSFDTLLAVYTGTGVASLTRIAANDDAPGLNFASRVQFEARAGTAYRIAVAGFGSARGSIRLTVALASPIPPAAPSTATVPPLFPVRQASVGRGHACAISQAGAAYCWGDNSDGQIGNNGRGVPREGEPGIGLPDSLTVTVPAAVIGLERDMQAVAAGWSHSCGLTTAGEIRCWGANGEGQLGTGTLTPSLVAMPTPLLGSGNRAIAAASDASCAINSAGGVVCWGVGTGRTPAVVPGLAAGVTRIAMGGDFHAPRLCAVMQSGALNCWNGAGSARQEVAGNVADVTVGRNHTCVRTLDGAAECWGVLTRDQFLGPAISDGTSLPGDPVNLGAQHRPGFRYQGFDSGVLAVSSGGDHICALRSDAIICFGFNSVGQLGIGRVSIGEVQNAVQGLPGRAVGLASGSGNSCAILEDGRLACWGYDLFGQAGDGDLERLIPEPVAGLPTDIVEVAIGAILGCGRTSQGRVFCWGLTAFDFDEGIASVNPQAIEITGFPAPIVSLIAGEIEICGRTANGQIHCWGAASGHVPRPVAATPPPPAPRGHSCGLTAETGTAVVCVGSNSHGQLGDGSTIDRNQLVRVTGLANGARSGGTGAKFSCVLLQSGEVRCWGDSALGQTGNGFGMFRTLPGLVIDESAARRVAASVPAPNAPATHAITDGPGRHTVFQSAATNLVQGDTNNRVDIFISDRTDGSVRRVSVDEAGAQISGDSIEPSVSANGNLVVFVAPDAGVSKLQGESEKAASERRKSAAHGLFLRNMLTGTTQRIGTAVPGGAGTGPAIAPGGTAVVYTTMLADASLGKPGQTEIMRTLLSVQSNGAVSVGASSCVSCKSIGTNGSPTSTNADGDSRNPVISADGSLVAWETQARNAVAGSTTPCPAMATGIILRNMLTGVARPVGVPAGNAQCGMSGAGNSQPQIDHAGQRLVFQSNLPLTPRTTSPTLDVYVADLSNGAVTRVSETPQGHDANGGSRDATISGDGRFVAYTSTATNIDPQQADNNEVADLYVHSLENGNLRRVSEGVTGDQGDSDSLAPALDFSGNSLVFGSASQNLLAQMTTGTSTVYRRDNPLAVGTPGNGVPPTTPPTSGGLRSDVWWIPSESGWGLFTTDQGSVLATFWYTYDVDGEPTWFLIPAMRASEPGRYTGDILKFTGVPLAQISGTATESSNVVGQAELQFIGDDRVRFDYRVGTVARTREMQRFRFGNRRLDCQPTTDRSNATNFSDLWWNPSQSGWGLQITHHDTLLVASWYTYDTDREAVFLTTVLNRQPNGSFSGDVFRQQNGIAFGSINGSPPSPGETRVGSASLSFSDGQTGTFSYNLSGVAQTRQIHRLSVGNTLAVCQSVTM